MNLTIPRSELKTAVTGLSRIMPSKPCLPILGGVRFAVAETGAITATATDLEQTAVYRFAGAHANHDGSFVIPLANLKDLAQGKSDEIVEFNQDGTSIMVNNHVGTHSIKHPVNGLDVDEWPACPDDVTTKPADGFLATYRKLIPFASTDETRYLLKGVFIEVAAKGDHPVTMVATDGRRLSLWNTMTLPLPQSVIVPTTKFLQWNGLTGDVELGLRTKRVKKTTQVLGLTIKAGPWSYDVRTIDGTYPNFRQVIPTDADMRHRITFTDEDVKVLIKILPTFPGANTNSAGIALRPGMDGKLVVAGTGTDNKSETALELTGGSRIEGGTPGIGVNAFYLIDALEAGFRVFTAMDGHSPLKSMDGRGGVHILMPLRLGNATIPPPEPPQVSQTSEPTPEKITPDEPLEEKNKQAKERSNMQKEANGSGTVEQGTTLDKVLAAVETAKGKLRDAVSSLSEVTDAVKVAVKEGKTQAADLEKARVTLQKLQAISL